jgi:hypothetical protein
LQQGRKAAAAPQRVGSSAASLPQFHGGLATLLQGNKLLKCSGYTTTVQGGVSAISIKINKC